MRAGPWPRPRPPLVLPRDGAERSVWTRDLKAPSDGSFMRIVVGVDGSRGAQRAFDWSVAEGRARGVGVTALLAYGYYGRPFGVQSRTAGTNPEQLDAAARE